MAEALEWTIDIDEGAARAVLTGVLDFTGAPEARAALDRLRRGSKGDVTLEVGRLERLDSSGLAVLIEQRRKLAQDGRSLNLLHVQPGVERLFRLTQVEGLFGY